MAVTDSGYSFTQLTMAHFELKLAVKLNLTSHSELVLIGQCFQTVELMW